MEYELGMIDFYSLVVGSSLGASNFLSPSPMGGNAPREFANAIINNFWGYLLKLLNFTKNSRLYGFSVLNKPSANFYLEQIETRLDSIKFYSVKMLRGKVLRAKAEIIKS
jgi:hypothetical protein